MKALVIAGMQSGTGKTTVAAGLMAAFARRGMTVQPYKVGPDYIDPSYHTVACGRPCRNLDRWMLDLPTLHVLFHRWARRADVSVIEGVMGLFDGRTGEGERASTAEVAKALGAPVILVLDVARIARTAAALVAGVRAFDPALQLAGVILNRVASDTHIAAIAPAIERETGVPVLGAIRRDDTLAMPERYLGLVPVPEAPEGTAFLDRASATVASAIDLDALLRRLPDLAPSDIVVPGLFPDHAIPTCVRIAIARDRAFHFYYEDSLDLLRAWGAELLPFSPLADDDLPDGTQAVYLGGGFPELFATELAANEPMKAALRRAAACGMPVYGECGGYMYLGTSLTDRESHRHAMAGVVPLVSSMARGKLTLGYRDVTALRDTPLARHGEHLPGHEFHWSVQEAGGDVASSAYDVDGPSPRREGYAAGSILGSYVHLHLGSDPRLAPRFIAACEAVTPLRTALVGPQPATHRSPADAEVHATASNEPVPVGQRASGGAAVHALDAPPVARASPGETPDRGGSATVVPPAPTREAGALLRRFGLSGPEIEARSLGVSDAVLDAFPWTGNDRAVARRLMYSVGDPDIAPRIRIHPRATEAGIAALRNGATVVCDVKMVASGISGRLASQYGCGIITAIDHPEVTARSQASGYPRSAEAMHYLGSQLDGAVVAIGNAPTALLALLDLVDEGRVHPALVVGMPVGFTAAVESKEALLARQVPYITVTGTRGGTPLAVAAVNALLLLAGASGG